MYYANKKREGNEPLAIVGIGCRLPGGINDPRSFWDALCNSKDAITEVPPDRWDVKAYFDTDREKPGKVYTSRGGFLQDIEKFDPQFFGISPREASFMDPQQRILLEVTWEALEDAGIQPEEVAGTNAGVFIGLFMHDFENTHNSVTERDNIGSHSAVGMSTTIAANRISYVFDLKGPSMVIDTACSSSLVAVHLACQSLLNGETNLAVAGGANIILKPEMTMALCKGSFLSPDGRCKSFDSSADGYVRSEGVGVVIIKRLSDALADKDPIYSLIIGTAVNQDGKSAGLTVPDGKAQMSVLRAAISNSGVKPSDVQYVEAHGTGTNVGDPIEADALGTVLSEGREDDERLAIGSVKSNIGHTESAAGIAGIIKTSLMLKHGLIPPNLHFNTPNPKIQFEKLKLRVVTELEAWPDKPGKPRVAGVNSFGFGGTNAHAVLKEYLKPVNKIEKTKKNKGEAHLVPVSGHSKEALEAVVRSYIKYLDNDTFLSENITMSQIANSASRHKGHHSYRLAAVARSKEELSMLLKAFINGEKIAGVSYDQIQMNPGKLAFVFAGMGQQWWKMGRQSYLKEPVFKKIIDECDILFSKHTKDWNLIEELFAEENNTRINQTQISQPCIFSVQVALHSLWLSKGIVPDAVMGHSVGEVAAYYAAGILSLEDAVAVCYHRSRLQQLKAGQGGMLAVGIPIIEAEKLVKKYSGRVSLAAINSENSLTLAGDINALEEIANTLEGESKFSRFLKVEVPYHSPSMDSILEELKKELSFIISKEGKIQAVSTVTGRFIEGKMIKEEYWAQNVRKPVLFAEAFMELTKEGFDKFVEVSAHPTLVVSMMDILDSQGIKATVLAALKRNEDEERAMLNVIGQLYIKGYPVTWDLISDDKYGFCKLPSYKWQREVFWKETEETKNIRRGYSSLSGNLVISGGKQPLLGEKLKAALPIWNIKIDAGRLTYLEHHYVQGNMVFPAAAYIEMAIEAAAHTFDESSYFARDVEIKAPLILSKENSTIVQLILEKDDHFEIFSKPEKSEKDWTLHVKGYLGQMTKDGAPCEAFENLRRRCANEVDKGTLYKEFYKRGLEYGNDFQTIERLWLGDDAAFSVINASKHLAAEHDNYIIHPVIMDAGFQTLASIKSEGTYLPVRFGKINVYSKPLSTVWCYSRLDDITDDGIEGTVSLFDDKGKLIAEINNLYCRKMQEYGRSSQENIYRHLYEYKWIQDAHFANNCSKKMKNKFPSNINMFSKLKAETEELVVNHQRERYYQIVEPAFDRLCTQYITEAFEKLGLNFIKGSIFSSVGLAERLGVSDEHHKVFERFLNILEEDGILKKGKESWLVLNQPAKEDHNILWNEILKREPEYQCELQLLNGCASRLSEILKGEEDPLSFIFSNSSLSIEQFYKSSSTMKVYNVLLSKVMKSIVEGIPKEKTLRILEVGAGTGSLTSYVLPLLPPYRTEYSFTDISGLFTIQAEKRFSDYEFIEYKTLDIEKDPINQGFEPNVFDIVLASDAIHATSHLTDTIENIKKLLAPGGMLIFIEQAKVTRWFDLVFGLLKGWWLFSDHDIRPHYPLMQMSSWERLLRESGFKDISFMPEKELGHIPQHSLIIARGAEDIEALRTEASSREDLKTRKWIVFADDKGVAERFGSKLEKKGIKHIFVLKGDKLSIEDPLYLVIQQDQPEHYGIVLDFLCRDSNSTPVVINMWSLMNSQNKFDMSLTQAESKEPSIYSCIDTSVHILYLMQALIKNIWQETPHLWIITKGLHAVGEGKTVEVTEAPVWGLGRVMISENQNIITRLVDLSPVIGDHELEMLVTQLLFPSDEDEMVLRGDCLYVHRLTRKNQNELLCKPDVPYVLKMCKDKAFKELEFVQASRKSPLKGEVEVRIHAAGVNFKDVVRQSGLLEDNILVNKDSSGELGQECSGTVIAVGEGVEQFKVGDKVMGLAFNSFARYATLDERILVKVPENISFEGAATIPLVFLSSYYALNRLAGIKRGERVLIHTAASGVGLSAIQIALAAGAEVLATAGTPEKRDFLKAMGIKFVADSRSLEFADEIMNYTGNEGVDIILNTLPEKTIETSMSVLKPITGRFIDISNIYSNSIRLYSPHKGITFHSFDLNSMVRKHPQNAREMLDEIAEKLNAGIYSPIPYWTFPVSETANALITMKKGLHIGKIVISMGEDVVTRPSKKIQVTEDGTYLITGGLGGFGLAAAEWLVQCGARNLVLVGRKGASTPHAREVIGKLIKNGVKIGVECADITREESVKEIFSKIENEMPSLKGVIHAAMVLEDAFLTDMNETKMSKVMEPKILGGWNLHVNTLDKKLDFFICFSSFASMVGNSDQGNYVAANVFLESLATLRQSMNLPALTVCWGPLGDVGYVSQRDEIKEHFKRQGFREISIGQAWETISIALDNNLTTVGIAPVDWKTAARYNNSIDRSPRYSKLVGKSQDSSKIDEKHISNIKITSQMQSHERKQMFTEVLSSEVATILGVPVSKLDANLPFSALGFDSLMAVELVVRIEETVGIKLPKMTLMRAGLNIYELVDIVEKEIENKRGIITKEGKAIENRTEGIEEKGKSIEAAEEKEGVEKNMESSALGKEDMPANVDELTDEEVEELLSRMLLKGDEKGEKK